MCNKINNKDCINFFNLATNFNQVYKEYLLNLENLKNLLKVFGEKIEYDCCYKSGEDLSFSIDVTNPYKHIYNSDWAIILMHQLDGEYEAIATDNNRFYNSINITPLVSNQVSNIMKIIKNHYLFLDAYSKFQYETIFFKGNTFVDTNIKGNIFNLLDKFIIELYNESSLHNSEHIIVKFQLGMNLEIMYDESEIIINNEKVNDKKKKIECINNIINDIYIDNSLLSKLYNNQEKPQILIKKSDNN